LASSPVILPPLPPSPVTLSEDEINAEVERRFKEILEKKELAKKAFEKEVEERLAKKIKEMETV
jgi:hypothetical protein